MAAETISDNTFVAGLAAETYFAVKLQLVGYKDIYNKYRTHDINCRKYSM